MDEVDGLDDVDLPGVAAEVLLDCVLSGFRGHEGPVPDTFFEGLVPIEPMYAM